MYAPPRSPHHPADIDWRPLREFLCPKVPTATRAWLLDTGSLTQRLVDCSQHNFRVQLLSHHWQRPLPSERRALGLHRRELAIVREVYLLCHGQPWVFARSVIPAQTLSGRLRRLRKFSDSSLGQLLFSEVSMRRQPFELARIAGDHPALPPQVRQDLPLWGRRCRFTITGKPLLVSEIFLPAFQPWTE